MTTSHQYNYQDYVPTEGVFCPICQAPCVSLQDLNNHLDREHSEEDSKGALLSWLRNAQKKVSTSLTTKSVPKQWVDLSSNPSFFVSDQQQSEYVTQDHWQRETGNDKCQMPECTKIVGKSGAGKQHCRKCGKLFCAFHTQYEIKLNRQAQHDPENGVWCKVCMGCYVGRKGYMDHGGVTRDKTSILLSKRVKIIDKVHLESNRLEKRLEKLARIHLSTDSKNSHNGHFVNDRFNNGLLSPSSSVQSISLDRSDSASSRDSSLGSILSPKSSFVSSNNSILSMKLKYRDGEQSVTKWEDDKLVKKCPYCESTFTLINRKHHCRLCGKVVCGNIRCSKMIPLYVDMSSDTFDTEPVGDTRACCHCVRYAFRRKLLNEQSQNPSVIFRLYNQLAITRKNIENQLPKFHQLILALEKEKALNRTSESFLRASQIRKSLLDNFALYDTLVKSIKALPARSSCMKRLQTNICAASNIYLQQNMLPLQMLPRILKEKPERKQLKQQLETYLEQTRLVEGFIRDAEREGKYDNVKTLKVSLEELHGEIENLRAKLD